VSLAVWQRPDQQAAPVSSAASAEAAVAAAAAISTAPGAAGHKLIAVGRIPLRSRAEALAALHAGGGCEQPHLCLLAQPLAYYLEPALDSSRYFALRIGGAGGRSAVLGIGTRERQASFDLRSCLDDVLQRVARSMDLVAAAAPRLRAGAAGGAGAAAAGDAAAAAAAAAALAALPDVAIGPLAPRTPAGGAAAAPQPLPRLAAPRAFSAAAAEAGEWGEFAAAAPAEQS